MYQKDERISTKCSLKSLREVSDSIWISFECCDYREDIKRGLNEKKIIFDDNYNLVYSDTIDNYKLHFAEQRRYFEFTYLRRW